MLRYGIQATVSCGDKTESEPTRQRQPGTGHARNLGSQRASCPARVGERWHLAPPSTGSAPCGRGLWAAGGGARGRTRSRPGPPLTCRARAVVSTQQEVQQMEKPRRSRTLLPRSSTTNTWRAGAQEKQEAQDPKPHQTHPCPVPPSQEAPRPARTPLLKGVCEDSQSLCAPGVCPEWPGGHSTAQSRGPFAPVMWWPWHRQWLPRGQSATWPSRSLGTGGGSSPS